MKRYVNLGCGSRYHPDWINIDIDPQGPGVMAHDLSRGIPLADGAADVVYHSHVLEHLRRGDAAAFLTECHRVLAPGGVIRIAVPDLERIARSYLDALARALAGEAGAAADYEWMMMEMVDQMTRETSGGAMAAFLRAPVLENEAFILDRIGEEGRRMIEAARKRRATAASAGGASTGGGSRAMLRNVRRSLRKLVRGEEALRDRRVGSFRHGGEVHQWMYDRFSLARLLESVGFVEPTVHSATSSAIEGWAGFNLDTTADGTIVKPDSLFMEGLRS